MRLKLFTLIMFITCVCFSQQTEQTINVSGNVEESDTGTPLPGVNILIKGTSLGTSTDFDGNFKLENVKIGSVLVVSYIGFKTKELLVENTNSLKIYLEGDSESLDEVVVIGYGTLTKKEITGAVSVIDSEVIEKTNPTRVEQALQGRVPGVNITSQSGSPGAALNISIRGISTNGDNRPLILVDGNVIEDLTVLSPNDIESINVLKDATAGIYGVRAANGVILITTKSGRKNSDLSFELNSYTGFQTTSKRMSLLNATEYGVIVNEAYASGGDTPPFNDLSILGEGTDWQDEVFRTAAISNVDFSVHGGGEKSTYSIGGSYLTQDGIVGGGKANFERATARLNYSLDIIDNLKFTTSWIYSHSNRSDLSENALGSVLFNAVNMSPILTVRDENGDFTLAEGLGNEVINPLAQIENTSNDNQINRVSGTFGLKYTLFDKISAESRFQFNYAEVDGETFAPEAFYGSGKVFNIDRNNINETFNVYRDYTWDNFITYNNTFADNHNLTVLLGMSVFRSTGEQFKNRTGFDLPTNNYEDVNIGDALEIVDNLETMPPTYFDARLLSYFTRLQYNYKGKYLLSAVVRRDGSSRFGPKNKFGIFPSGSIGWVASEESFLENSTWLDFLKFRGSYGVIGNDRIPDFRFVSLLDGEGTYVFNDERFFGSASGAIANPEIRWEKQKTLDFGVDIRLANKIDITADYFNRETEDLLLQPQVSGILGAAAPASASPTVNAGTVQNKGFEFMIGYNDQFSDSFKFNISYNLTMLDNEVLLVDNENGYIDGGAFGIGLDPPSRMEAGFPLGYFYGLETNGIFQSQAEVDAHATQANAAPGDLRYVDMNNDGTIDGDDRTYIGDPFADVTMGLTIGFDYKNFDFSAYTFASIGNEIVRNYERSQPLTNRSTEFINRWTGAGSSNSNPRVTTGASSNLLFSDFYVEDGSFLRIQNIQLGYTLSQKLMEPIGVKTLRFYASVNNPFTFTKYRGFDPSASISDAIGRGIDQGFYPVARTYMLGLKIKF